MLKSTHIGTGSQPVGQDLSDETLSAKAFQLLFITVAKLQL